MSLLAVLDTALDWFIIKMCEHRRCPANSLLVGRLRRDEKSETGLLFGRGSNGCGCCWTSTVVAVNVPANMLIRPKMIRKLPFARIPILTFSFAALPMQKKCWLSSRGSAGLNGRGDVSVSADITCLHGKVLPSENNNISFVVFSRLSQAWCCNSRAPSQPPRLSHTLIHLVF